MADSAFPCASTRRHYLIGCGRLSWPKRAVDKAPESPLKRTENGDRGTEFGGSETMHLTPRWDTTPTPPRALPTLNSESAILELRLCLYLCAEATSSWNPLCCRCFCTFGCWSGFVFQIGAAAPPTQKVEGKTRHKEVSEREDTKEMQRNTNTGTLCFHCISIPANLCIPGEFQHLPAYKNLPVFRV